MNEWSRADLEVFAASRRKDPPKVRRLIDWMEANNVESMSDPDDELVIDVAQKLGHATPYASLTDIFLGRRGVIQGGAFEQPNAEEKSVEAGETESAEPDGQGGDGAGEGDVPST